MLDKPMKRICPSLIANILANTDRQTVGLKNGSKPSNTSNNANAPSSMSAPHLQTLTSAAAGRYPNPAWP